MQAVDGIALCDDGNLPNSVAFVMMNVENGNAIVLNAGKPMYPASSVKAMFCYYVLSARAAELNDYDRQLIEDIILYSDNDSYFQLTYNYSDADAVAWFAGYGIDFSNYTENTYPMISARAAARIWRDMLFYIESDTADAIWFKDLLDSTTVSFARDAVTGELGRSMIETGDITEGFEGEPVPVPDGMTIYNKAGWIADWEVNALVDCGIIRDSDGTRYIFAFMTDAAESSETIPAFETLIQETWHARSALS
jgi:hypothetical protein